MKVLTTIDAYRTQVTANLENGLKAFLILLCALFSFSAYSQTEEGKITFRVIAEHHDGRKSVSNEVVVYRPATLYIPNAFTPDGDGINDLFQPKGEGITSFELAVYDRWGNLVHRSEQPSEAWDGTSPVLGTPAPEGVYAYQLIAFGSHDERIERTGSVTLVIP